jgi:hypothetical protein
MDRAAVPEGARPPRMTTRAGVLLGLLGLALAGGAGARADDEPSKVRFGADLQYEYFSYLTSLGGEVVDSRNAVTAIPRVDWTPSTDLRLRGSLLMRKDFAEEERSRIYAYDAYLSLERESWGFSIGREVVSWGRADSLRPTNVFQRHDYTDLIEDRVEATDVVRLTLSRGNSLLEGVWAPVFTPDIISYAPDNRWNGLPAMIDVEGVGPVNLSFDEAHRRSPARTVASGQVGLRFSGTAGGWDYAGMTYYGYDRVPTYMLAALKSYDQAAQAATLELTPVHKRITVVGGDFAKALSAWTVRGEAAYTFTADLSSDLTGINDPYYRFSGGIDRTISSTRSAQSLSFSLQYVFDSEPAQPGPLDQQNVNPMLHPFHQAVVVNSTWKFTESVRFNLKGYVNIVEYDFVLQPEIVWKPIDSMAIVLGGDTLSGKTTTFFGQYRDNDRVRCGIAYTF